MEDVQEAAGHVRSSTTQIYDHRGNNPERAASLFASYQIRPPNPDTDRGFSCLSQTTEQAISQWQPCELVHWH